MISSFVDCHSGLMVDGCHVDVQVMSIVFDKTGTLTHGVPHVSHVVMFVPRSDMSLQTILAIAGSAETSSEHPIGTAIVTYVKKVVLFSFDLVTCCLKLACLFCYVVF